jgi:hypothetical protein
MRSAGVDGPVMRISPVLMPLSGPMMFSPVGIRWQHRRARGDSATRPHRHRGRRCSPAPARHRPMSAWVWTSGPLEARRRHRWSSSSTVVSTGWPLRNSKVLKGWRRSPDKQARQQLRGPTAEPTLKTGVLMISTGAEAQDAACAGSRSSATVTSATDIQRRRYQRGDTGRGIAPVVACAPVVR